MRWLEVLISAIFWISAAGVIYVYACYPVILWLLARAFGRDAAPDVISNRDQLPSISLLVAAYNEQAVIGQRIENALSLDYPADKLEIVIASDGSDDSTLDIVRKYADRGVRLLAYETRRGKSTVLNAARHELRGDIVMLSDANTFTDPDAARNLVRWFSDPTVGVVCGKLVLTDASTGRNVDGMYWKYETFLKICESRLGALLGSNGAIYAIRRNLFQPIPSSTIVDDFVIPLVARRASNCRIIFDQQAIAREETAPDVAGEFRRRCRIGAGGFQAIGMLWPLLDPRQGWIAFTFFSHKILRWLCPFFMILLIVSNLALVNIRMYQLMLGLQVLFYATAAVGPRITSGKTWAKVLRLANMFVMMNLALLIGFFRWISNPQTGTWARTQRLGELDSAGQMS